MRGKKNTSLPTGKRGESHPGGQGGRYAPSRRRAVRRVVHDLVLYVAGNTPRSTRAIANVRSLCDEFLPGRYTLEVVDIYQQPTRATAEQIIAAPTLVKRRPTPLKRIIGDLSERARVITALGLAAADPTLATPWNSP